MNNTATTESLLLYELDIEGDFPTVCEWFLNCTNEPTHLVSHPILDWVPACTKCKNFATR